MSRLKVMSTRTFSRPAFFNLLSFLPSGSILPWVLKNNNNNWISLAPYGHNIRGTEGIWHYCLVAQYPYRVGLIRGMATLPQGNQELLEVRDKVGRTWGEQVHGMWYFSIQCFDTVGWAPGRAVVTTPSSFASINTGYPRFTWKMAVKTKRERERVEF